MACRLGRQTFALVTQYPQLGVTRAQQPPLPFSHGRGPRLLPVLQLPSQCTQPGNLLLLLTACVAGATLCTLMLTARPQPMVFDLQESGPSSASGPASYCSTCDSAYMIAPRHQDTFNRHSIRHTIL